MKDFRDAIDKQVAAMFSSGKVDEMIQKQLEDTMKEVIKDAFRAWSPFGKGLKEYVESNLQVDFNRIKLDQYNNLILKVIQEHLDSTVLSEGLKDMKEQMDKLIKDLPTEVKLSSLIEDMMEESQDSAIYGNWDEPTYHVEKSEYGENSYHIYLDPRPNKRKYECSYKIYTSDGEVRSVSVEGENPERKIFVGPHYGFARQVLAMYTGKCKLSVDFDEYEQEFRYEHCRCD